MQFLFMYLYKLWKQNKYFIMFAKSLAASCILDIGVGGYFSPVIIDREFEFYEFFSFLKFNEFYEFFFRLKKIRKKIVILQIIDV